LINKKILFNPEYNLGEVITIKGIIDTLVKDFMEIAINIQRVDTGGVGDYLVEMRDNFEIRFIIANIYQNLETIHGKMI